MQVMALKFYSKFLNEPLDHSDLDRDLENDKGATKTIRSMKWILHVEQQS